LSGDVVGCIACDLTAGREPLPGGVIFDSGAWRIEHTVGPLGVGTLIVKPVRHVVHVAELTTEEAAELGALLHTASSVVTELVRPEQVYVCLWSHAGGVPGHIHFVVQPVSRELMDRHAGPPYGPMLQVAMFEAGESLPEDEVEAFCERARLAAAPRMVEA
jgi:diadenosine tetraphosphate (Ap4A) HIT family hydrolase